MDVLETLAQPVSTERNARMLERRIGRRMKHDNGNMTVYNMIKSQLLIRIRAVDVLEPLAQGLGWGRE